MTLTTPMLHKKFDVTFIGKASHAGINPENGVSAIMMAVMFCAEMPTGEIAPRTFLALSALSGGHAMNIVADKAQVTLQISGPDAQTVENALEVVKRLCQKVNDRFYPLQTSSHVLIEEPACLNTELSASQSGLSVQ